MALKIGRVGLDVALRNAGGLSWKGDVLEVEGHLSASSASDLEAIREQLLGYTTNTDEPALPVLFDVDPTVNGFYRLADEPQISTVASSYSGGLVYPFRCSLRRVPRFASPFFESSALIALKTNSLSLTQTLPSIGLPGGYYNLVQQIGSLTSNYPNAPGNIRASEDGSIDFAGRYSIDASTTALMTGRNLIRFGVSAANYFLGGCKLSFGSTPRAVTGPSTAIGSTTWSMSNGLVKVSSVSGNGDLDIGFWGGSYRTKRYRILTSGLSGTYTQLPAPLSIQVVKVATHCVTIRLFYALSNQSYSSGNEYLDLTLRRGSPTLEGIFTRTDVNWYTGVPGVRLAMATTEDATSATGYIWATTTDGAGLKYVILYTSSPISTDTVNGSVTFASSSTPRIPFGFSAVIDPGSTGLNYPYTISSLQLAFMTEIGETVQVVS